MSISTDLSLFQSWSLLGGDSAVKLLTKFGLLESAIDYAAENW